MQQVINATFIPSKIIAKSKIKYFSRTKIDLKILKTKYIKKNKFSPQEMEWTFSNKKTKYKIFTATIVYLVALFTFVSTLLTVYGKKIEYLTNIVPQKTVYENIYNRSVQLIFTKKSNNENSEKFEQHVGTGWILDYELEPKNKQLKQIGSYPKTFYFATAVHLVCQNKLSECVVSLLTGTADPSGHVSNEKEILPIEVKIIYSAINFVKPKYLQNIYTKIKKWYSNSTENFKFTYFKNNQQPSLQTKQNGFTSWSNLYQPISTMIDFIVLKIVFKNEKDARFSTHNFADKNKKTSFWTYNVNQKHLLAKKRYYIGGYSNKTWSINTENPNRLEGQTIDKQTANNSFYSPMLFQSKVQTWNQFENLYANYGTKLTINNSSLGPGSSGSIVCDEKNNIVGIHWGGNQTFATSSIHLLANRFVYVSEIENNLGNFQQLVIKYDLIHKNDYSTSYEEELKKQNPKINTYLFPR